MQTFLIHRNADGQIVRAIPYANIEEMSLIDNSWDTSLGSENWRVDYLRQNGLGSAFSVTKEDADRYLSEWRAWWETGSRDIGEMMALAQEYTAHGELIGIKIGESWFKEEAPCPPQP